jgi:hypothetical protein
MRKKRVFGEKQMQDRRAARLRWYYKNRERAREKHMEWIAANKRQQVEYSREYDATHRQERREKAKRRRAERPETARDIAQRHWLKYRAKKIAENRKWKAEHPDECQAYNKNRLARKRNASGRLSAAQWRAILKAHGFRCCYCGARQTKDRPLTRDHYIALSRGGSNFARNIVPACHRCNSTKKARDPIEFARPIGRLV